MKPQPGKSQNGKPTGIEENVFLAPHTSWQIGGNAQYFARPSTIEEIVVIQNWAQSQNLPVHHLGGGSNVLVSDRGLSGVTISLDQLKKLEILEPAPNSSNPRLILIAEAGVGKNELLKTFLKYKLAPALFLAGIPGTVGGGVVMNAGVAESFQPREFCEITDWVEVLTTNSVVVRQSAKELHWSYRHCSGWQPGVIVRVGLSWPLQPDPAILDQVRNANKTRLSKQPLELPSCGSVFVNPAGHKAAQLIDSAGLKGYTVGGAQVSMKHANFIVNQGNAKASDVAAVIRHVQSTVREKHGVDLKTEVVFMGDHD